ncbi:MAG: phosphoribosylamine--glycine ligase [Anaeroplasmataceae bacterium]|nr:phosphoribosylamine--glycine ligase [Anaeroplasmataceae bacterium]
MKKVLVIGSGGREHAIIDAICKSRWVSQVFAAPGNAGMVKLATCVDIRETEIDKLVDFAMQNEIDLTIVGPEVSLALGIVNAFLNNNLCIFGPTKEAAIIESSKEYAKNLMMKYNIPTATYKVFTVFEEAFSYIKQNKFPIVLKYDGLAAGKGVIIAYTLKEAEQALRSMLLEEHFGKGSVIVEEFLEGEEFSFMCLCNHEQVYPLEMAQDHKRAYDNDQGPNTGGMGAYSPVPFLSSSDKEYALNSIMIPTAKALVQEKRPFCGILYGGLIKTKTGIKVIEFNCRFGDPETEVVLPRLRSDLYEVIMSVLHQKKPVLEWEDFSTIGIVLASKGYPEQYKKGYVIHGADQNHIYHMGTTLDEQGQYLTAGGRVLFVVEKGSTLEEANHKALQMIESIHCENLFHRTDIGKRILKK